MAEFYTSGRASNEAAFLYQLFVREFGTNNFPDCSNMCHEATSVGLPESIGVGKGTVTLDDFDHCDCIFCIGQNPGTNHPRMMTTLREASRRGVPIVAFNPLRERALERFASPQDPVEMVTLGSTPIASSYYQVKVGGDVAVLKGMMKACSRSTPQRSPTAVAGVLDLDFIAEHTAGFDALLADLEATSWEAIERHRACRAPTSRASATSTPRRSASSSATAWASRSTATAPATCSRSPICCCCAAISAGRAPASARCAAIPTCRATARSASPRSRTTALLDGIADVFGFEPPRAHGHDAVEAIEAMRDGRSKALICLGGNLAVAMSDPEPRSRRCASSTSPCTSPPSSTARICCSARQSFILPCLGRTELDMQASGPQSVTVEDSMSMVHASRGGLKPASEHLRSEPAIVAGIAMATLPNTKVAGPSWSPITTDPRRDRRRVSRFRGFQRAHPAARRLPPVCGGLRARMADPEQEGQFPGLFRPRGRSTPRRNALTLTTIRSHDQYNTTIYGLNDRYRGITGRRDVVFVNENDLASRGLKHGDLVDVRRTRREFRPERAIMRNLTAVAYNIAEGSVAAYYPEANVLVALDHYDVKSGTPSYKSTPVQTWASSLSQC